jgi:hypothetical protein
VARQARSVGGCHRGGRGSKIHSCRPEPARRSCRTCTVPGRGILARMPQRGTLYHKLVFCATRSPTGDRIGAARQDFAGQRHARLSEADRRSCLRIDLVVAAQRFGIKVVFTCAAATITTPASSTPVGAAPIPQRTSTIPRQVSEFPARPLREPPVFRARQGRPPCPVPTTSSKRWSML